MSLEFVRKTATFRTSFFSFHLLSQVFVNQHVQQNDVLGKMSPFLEHLSVQKGCQQAWPSARPQRRAKALASVIKLAQLRRFASIDPKRRIVPAAFFRAAARGPVLPVLATPAERRETILSGGLTSPWPACDVRKGIHATSRAPYSPACLSAGLAAASGTEAGSMTMRLLD